MTAAETRASGILAPCARRGSSSGSTRSSRSAAPPAPTGPGWARASSAPSTSWPAGCARPGLEVAFDAAGNLYGRLPGSEPALPEIWSGSHLDTPPDGGRFDGALGVLAALDAPEAIGASGRRARARWRPSPSGSRRARASAAAASAAARCAACSRTTRAICATPTGVTLAEAFAALGYGELPRGRLARPAARLLRRGAHRAGADARRRAGAPLGIVTSIAGHGRRRDRLRGPARPRRHGADGAARATRSPPRPRFVVARARRRAASIPGAVARSAA